MTRHWILAAAIAGLAPLSATNALAQPIQANVAKSSPRTAAAREIAMLFGNKDGLKRYIDPTLDMMVQKIFASTAFLVKINQQNPGLDIAFRDTLRPFLEGHLEQIFPEYVTECSEFIVGRFSDAEIMDIKAFLAGEVGQAFLLASAETITPEVVFAERAAGDGMDNPIAKAERSKALEKLMRELTARQRLELEHFLRSPTGQKFLAALPEINEIQTRWANQPARPDIQDRMTEALNAAIEAHVAVAESKASSAQ